MRGLFTMGCLDLLMEKGITFDAAVGVSAGVTFGCNLKSGQKGRVLRYVTRYCRDWRFCSFRSLLLTGDLFGSDFCYTDIPFKLDPWDSEAWDANPMDFYVTATDTATGKAVFRKVVKASNRKEIEWFRASASMPIVSRPVKIGRWTLLDGGIADSIPLHFLEDKGMEKNVVILTQPIGFVKMPAKFMPAMRLLLARYPAVVRTMARRHEIYNLETAYARKRAQEGKAFIIAPPESLGIGHICHDPEELRRVYNIGRQTMEEKLPSLLKFLGQEE